MFAIKEFQTTCLILLIDWAKDNVPYLLATAANRSRIKRESEYNIVLSLTNIFSQKTNSPNELANYKENDAIPIPVTTERAYHTKCKTTGWNKIICVWTWTTYSVIRRWWNWQELDMQRLRCKSNPWPLITMPPIHIQLRKPITNTE